MATKTKETGEKKAPRRKAAWTRQEGKPRVKLAPELYGSTRGKLRAKRGKAGEHKCVECKETATAWTFEPKGNAPVLIDPNGLRFSEDLEDYRPRCGAHRGAFQKKAEASRQKAAKK